MRGRGLQFDGFDWDDGNTGKALGETDAGRKVRVVFTCRRRGAVTLVRPITALNMNPSRRRLYEHRKRR